MTKLKDSLKHLDRVGSATLTVPRQAFLDKVVVPVSEAANGVPVWLGCAAGLAATGARGRRVAGRGLVSMAVASAVADQGVKRLVGRSRPFWLVGRRAPSRTSASFPSGHATTAAAFAVTGLLEWPAVGIPLGILAAIVGYGRVYSRQHYVLDVIGGTVIGAAVAALVHRLGSKASQDPRHPGRDDRVSL